MASRSEVYKLSEENSNKDGIFSLPRIFVNCPPRKPPVIGTVRCFSLQSEHRTLSSIGRAGEVAIRQHPEISRRHRKPQNHIIYSNQLYPVGVISDCVHQMPMASLLFWQHHRDRSCRRCMLAGGGTVDDGAGGVNVAHLRNSRGTAGASRLFLSIGC